MKICIVGAGGIGSHLIPLMAQMGHRVVVMDGDTFEDKNLDRQRFEESYIGKNKADAMALMYPGYVDSEPRWLRETHQLRHFDFVICVPDNNRARMVALRAGKQFDIPVIIAGNESTSANACIYHPDLPKSDPLIRYPDLAEPDVVERISCHEAAQTAPQTMLANVMAASFASALFLFWTKTAPNLTKEILKDYATLEYKWSTGLVETVKAMEVSDE